MSKIKKSDILEKSERLGVCITYEDIENLSLGTLLLKEVTLLNQVNKKIDMYFVLSDNKIILANKETDYQKDCDNKKIVEALMESVQEDDTEYLERPYFKTLLSDYKKELISQFFYENKKLYEGLKLTGVGAIFSGDSIIDIFKGFSGDRESVFVYDTTAELNIEMISDVSVVFITEHVVVTIRKIKECETINDKELRYNFRKGELSILLKENVEIKEELLKLEELFNEPDKFNKYATFLLESDQKKKKTENFFDDFELL